MPIIDLWAVSEGALSSQARYATDVFPTPVVRVAATRRSMATRHPKTVEGWAAATTAAALERAARAPRWIDTTAKPMSLSPLFTPLAARALRRPQALAAAAARNGFSRGRASSPAL